VVAVSFRSVSKRFGSLLANDSISFDVERGTVHALLGENGAGKTTLLSILSGFLRADEGKILVEERELELGSPRISLLRGIGLCAQHFLLAGALTGAENVLLGRPGCRGLRPIAPERVAALRRLAEENGLEVPLDTPAEELSIAEQERLEILKLLERDVRLLVLDEPTSVLAPPEVGPLFATLRRLAAQGRTILLVTHRLAEVAQVADRVTVLRRGRVVGEADPREVESEQLVQWITGEQARPRLQRDPRPEGEVLLDVKGLSCGSGPSAPRRIDLTVREGRIVGLGGVLGNGQNEIVRALTGQLPLTGGTVRLFGHAWRAPASVGLTDDMAWIPDDRRGEGLALEMTCEENLRIGLPSVLAPKGGEALQRLKAFDVRPADPSLRVAHLSGGNQQRLLLAREMARKARLILAVHPTRGLDPASTAFVHERLLEARRQGRGILLVTGDLDELRALSDHLAILFRGAIRYEAKAEQVEPERMNRALVGMES
jgi:simple sugar transport system ATP-binding protein